MQPVLDYLSRYGEPVLFAFCFIEAIGFPLPSALALLAAGAASREGHLSAPAAFLAGLAGLLLGDVLLYLLGRVTGWWLLGMLCRLSLNPEGCILSSARRFHQKGRTALLFTKFLPGINTMAAPMAGSMKMRPGVFLLYDLGGALLYAGAYFLAGYLFSHLLGRIVEGIEQAGAVGRLTLVTALAAYFAYRVWREVQSRQGGDVPRIHPAALARVLQDGGVAVFDVRSHGYYEPNAVRIAGSSRLEPNRLPETMAALPPEKRIFLYCT